MGKKGGLKTALLLSLLLFQLINKAQSQLSLARLQEIGRNICSESSAFPVDNFSCVDDIAPDGQRQCFNESVLCASFGSSTSFCGDNSDIGSNTVFNTLECENNNRLFLCNTGGPRIMASLLCDGIDHCSLAGGSRGADEVASICDNKCLLPFYGGCNNQTEICDNSRTSVNCDCIEGFASFLNPNNFNRRECIPIGTVQFEEVTLSGTEGDTVEVCVNLTSAFPVVIPIPVGVIFTPGSAVQDDFTAISTTTFSLTTANPRGCVTVSLVDDRLGEQEETFFASLDLPVSATVLLGARSSLNISIIDNDVAAFEIVQISVTVMEDPGRVAIIGVRLGPNSGTLTNSIAVNLTTIIGTALAPEDFLSTSDTFTFEAGTGPLTPAQNFTVPIVDDNVVEEPEMFRIQASIQGPTGAFVSTGTAQDEVVITINDIDNLTVGFEFPTYTAFEGTMQEVCLIVSDGMLAAGVTLSADIITDERICDGLVQATASMDYNATLVPSSVSFSRGNPRQCTQVNVIQDSISETSEGFAIDATSTSGDMRLVITPSAACIEIPGDIVIFEFTQTMIDYTEGDPQRQICVRLTSGVIGPANGGVTINVESTSDGNATLNSDFTGISESLLFQTGTMPGSSGSRCFNFSPIDDPAVEYTETIIIMASSTTDVMFSQGRNRATIQIFDNDELLIGILQPDGSSVPDFVVPEDAGWVLVCAGPLDPRAILERWVSFRLSAVDGTGGRGAISVDPKDYQAKNTDFMITPSTVSDRFCKNITIIDDQLCEYDEYFSLVLQALSTSVAVTSGGIVNITDNDVAEITARNTYSVLESQVVLPIIVGLRGQKAPGRSCVVTWSTMDGTAISTGTNPDYIAVISETLIFTDTITTLDAEVEIRNNGLCEGSEYFQVFLSTDSDGCLIADGVSPINVTIIDNDLAGGGDDPHFSIALPGGKILCFTVQGEHGFSFNLISNDKMTMNAKFVPDSRREEVTWMGSMGIIVHHSNYKGSNTTKLRFEAASKKVFVGEKHMELAARNIESMTFKNGKLTISEAPPVEGYKIPSIYVDLQDVEVTFTMKFMTEHLDIYWHRTGGKITDSHGLIGQFFRKGVEIDEVRKILIMPDKEPVPVMRRPIWSFMERTTTDDQLCWTAMNPGYQGQGLIDGTYFDYLVDDIMSTDFKFSANKKQ